MIAAVKPRSGRKEEEEEEEERGEAEDAALTVHSDTLDRKKVVARTRLGESQFQF